MNEYHITLTGIPPSKKNSRWSKKELSWLKNNYPIYGNKYCCIKLNRGYHGVRQMSNNLKLKIKHDTRYWKNVNFSHGNAFRGKKRPEHSKLLKRRKFIPANYFTDETKKIMSKKHKLLIKNGKRTNCFRGHHHTDISKKKISKAGIGRISSKETIKKRQDTMMKKYGKLSINNSKNSYSRCKRGYYNINGKKIYFRSLWEANYALYLNFLKKIKEINDWKFEEETFWFEKIKRGIRSYTPDFKIIKNNKKIEFHEVKGWMDKKSATKIKRMAKYYPEVKLIVIDQDCYKDIKNKVGKMLKFYD